MTKKVEGMLVVPAVPGTLDIGGFRVTVRRRRNAVEVFGPRIRFEAIMRGWSRTRFAKECGIDNSSIAPRLWAAEAMTGLSAKAANSIATRLGVKVADLAVPYTPPTTEESHSVQDPQEGVLTPEAPDAVADPHLGGGGD